MIVLNHVTFAYPGQPPVFEEFSWQAAAGESWAVIGPSGCGKSTLLYLLAGLRQPTSGEVLVEEHPVPRPRASTGLILQDYGLLPWFTVRENIALGQRLGRFYRGKRSEGEAPRPYPPRDIPVERIDHWLQRLGLQSVQHKYPGQISGGQRQRAAIARTLLLQPTLLLMDEPFSSLDALTREKLEDVTRALQAETGVTTVIVTHNIEEAVYLGDCILVLGQAPHRRARVIENRHASPLAPSHADYRGDPAFQTRCNELRQALEGPGDLAGELAPEPPEPSDKTVRW